MKILFCIATVIALASCKSDKSSDLIIGKWTITDIQISPKMGIPPSEKSNVVKDAKMEFFSNRTYMTFIAGQEQRGRFTFSDDGKYLIVTPNGSEVAYVDSIVELTKNSFVVIDPKGNRIVAKN